MSDGWAASALQWWADAGVDTIVAEEPRDWLRAPREAPVPASPAGPETGLPADLQSFRAWLGESGDVPFAAPGSRRLLPVGDPASGLMILAGIPAAADFASGSLLSGDAGRLFGRMLAAIGRSRDSVYLAPLSVLPPPHGRFDPAPMARLARHHAGLVRPKALLLFGDDCGKALLGGGAAQLRGRWHEIDTQAGPIRTLVTMKPDTLLKQPSLKAHAWADLRMLMEGLQ